MTAAFFRPDASSISGAIVPTVSNVLPIRTEVNIQYRNSRIPKKPFCIGMDVFQKNLSAARILRLFFTLAESRRSAKRRNQKQWRNPYVAFYFAEGYLLREKHA
jgi:hypothetical protein